MFISDGLFASCPIQNDKTVECAADSSRYFVLRLSDGKGRHALIGIGFNDRAQAFDFKVALQDWTNHNANPSPPVATGPAADYSIPQGGSIHVAFGSGGAAKKKRNSASGADVSSALAGMKLDGPPGGKDGDKEKKKKKKKDKEAAADPASAAFGNLSAASAVVSSSSSSGQSSNIIDFGFGDFDPLSNNASKPAAAAANPFDAPPPRRASVADPFAKDSAPAFGATPFESDQTTQTKHDNDNTRTIYQCRNNCHNVVILMLMPCLFCCLFLLFCSLFLFSLPSHSTPFDDTPNDWVKF